MLLTKSKVCAVPRHQVSPGVYFEVVFHLSYAWVSLLWVFGVLCSFTWMFLPPEKHKQLVIFDNLREGAYIWERTDDMTLGGPLHVVSAAHSAFQQFTAADCWVKQRVWLSLRPQQMNIFLQKSCFICFILNLVWVCSSLPVSNSFCPPWLICKSFPFHALLSWGFFCSRDFERNQWLEQRHILFVENAEKFSFLH